MSDILFYTPILLVVLLVFLYTFWKILKDDYIPSQIFSTGFYALFFASLGYGLSYFAEIYRFWIIAGLFALGFTIGVKKKGIRFNEAIDAIALSVWIALLFSLPVLIKNWKIEWVLFYCEVAVSAVGYLLVKKHYKAFLWYKSGRRGFPAFFTIGLFFLLRSLITIINPEITLFRTDYDIFISGLISLISFLNIFILSK